MRRPVVADTRDAGSWLPQPSRDGLGVSSERIHRDHLCGPNESRQLSATTHTAKRQHWNRATETWACPPVSIPSPAAQQPDRELEHHRCLQLGETSINPGIAIGNIIQTLSSNGASIIGIPCNTAHASLIFNQIKKYTPKRCKLVHLVEEVAFFIKSH